MPWQLLADPNQYIWTWLGTYGGATGPIAGVLIADYWLVRRKNLKLADLYRTDGVYEYARGWNWIAVVSLVVGIVIAIGGAYSQTDMKPVPGERDHPVPQAVLRLQLDRGPPRGLRAVLASSRSSSRRGTGV